MKKGEEGEAELARVMYFGFRKKTADVLLWRRRLGGCHSGTAQHIPTGSWLLVAGRLLLNVSWIEIGAKVDAK